MDWIKSKETREQMAALRSEAEGLLKAAAAENRSLTAEEKTRFDEIESKHQEAKDFLDRADKLGSMGVPQNLGRDQRSSESSSPKIVVPTTARLHKKLKCFKSPEDAYLAGQFYAATLLGRNDARDWCMQHGVDIRNAQSEGTNSAGGYLVPTPVEQAIIDLREQYGVFRQFARVIPMTSDTHNVPKRSGGLTWYYPAENATITDSDKTWDNVQLVAKKLATLTRYSSELSEDAILNIADDLTSEIAQAFANAEDEAGFNGDGTSTYGSITGVLSAVGAGSTVDAATGNTAVETLDLTDFEKCVGKLPHYAGIQPVWFMHKAVYANGPMRLMDAAGGNTNTTLAQGPGNAEFLGYPVVFTQVLDSTLGADVSTVKAVFGDLRMAALMGNRRGISIATSSDRYFEYDQMAIRGTERYDIKIHDAGDASNAGAVVVLKTAAA